MDLLIATSVSFWKYNFYEWLTVDEIIEPESEATIECQGRAKAPTTRSKNLESQPREPGPRMSPHDYLPLSSTWPTLTPLVYLRGTLKVLLPMLTDSNSILILSMNTCSMRYKILDGR